MMLPTPANLYNWLVCETRLLEFFFILEVFKMQSKICKVNYKIILVVDIDVVIISFNNARHRRSI
jgi:hypothetical protein